jgi:hypothetical protein
MKTIKICDKEYDIDCNAFTYVQYKNIFGKGIFSDIQIIKTFFAEQSKTILDLKENGFDNEKIEKELNKCMLNNIDDFVEAITRLAYIFIYTVNSKIENYEKFLKEIPKLSIDDEWVIEVTEFAVEKFC